MTALAALGAEEYRARRAEASRRVADRRWTCGQAEAMLRPWLAIALAAGADPAPLVGVEPPLVASDVCPRAEWRAALLAAVNAVAGAAPTDAGAVRITRLACALGLGLGPGTGSSGGTTSERKAA